MIIDSIDAVNNIAAKTIKTGIEKSKLIPNWEILSELEKLL